MEYLTDNLWLAWIAAAISFLVLEMSTNALVSIWFVPAAVITCLVSLAVDNLLLQIALFVVLSLIFIFVFKKFYIKRIKKPTDIVKHEGHLIGKKAIAVEETDSDSGKVLVGDIYWRAKSVDGSKIQKNERVIIESVEGTTLIVRKGE